METLQESIIQVASRLFEQFGIRSVSIDNVCTELHISKKTFYIHFEQKEDLVDAVLNYQKKSNYEKYEKLFRNKNAIDSLIVIIKEIKKSLESESLSLCYDLEKYYPKVFQKHEFLRRNEIRQGFEMNLRQGIAEGYYREDLDVELISLFHSIQIKNNFELMEQSPKKYTKKRLIEFFIDLMIHLIANEKGLQYMKEHSLTEPEK
ncbi:MAG: TetR/AcrR family transcriptional regulator [Paludibacter sp.]|nr:TetR/AcrR family transcriptional regulator [Paludibacter sp.]